MRFWEDKSHLYDELSDRNKTMDELSIEEGTILFVWDGEQVGGQVKFWFICSILENLVVLCNF